jgi:hypothetical protein
VEEEEVVGRRKRENLCPIGTGTLDLGDGGVELMVGAAIM